MHKIATPRKNPGTEIKNTLKSKTTTELAPPLISIVVPVYNAEKFLLETFKTIRNQSYANWEAIFIDDKSSDSSLSLLREATKNEKRFRVLENNKNSGAALTRNRGIEVAKGNFLCFLDADDLWDKNKLNKQLAFMRKKDCAFSFTGYEFANEAGEPDGRKVSVPETISHKDALKNTTIWTTTVMFDLTKLNKKDIFMPDVPSEDTATWWKVLRTGIKAYGFNEQLSFYRRSPNTLSSSKKKAIQRIWGLYRKQERLSIFISCYYFCFWALNAISRRFRPSTFSQTRVNIPSRKN